VDNECSDYYPSHGSDIQVARYSSAPPGYNIFSSFAGMRRILNELNMPDKADNVYSLRFYTAAYYLKCLGRSLPKKYDECHKYTVEIFGLRVKLPEDFRFGMKVPLPDPTQYYCAPDYLTEAEISHTQIWRLRIISCSIEEVETRLSNPFGIFPPGTLYFEERWHHQDGKTRLIGGLEPRSGNYGTSLDGFRKNAICILDGYRKPGRPRGTRYFTPSGFRSAVKAHYEELYNPNERQPLPKEVAIKLGISVGTLKNYLDDLVMSHNLCW
jgi:hypothetical protein